MTGRAAIYNGDEGSQSRAMPHVATWIRAKDEKWFRRAFAKHPNVRLWNARTQNVPLEKMQGLLLSGGADVAPEFLHQPVPDPSILDTDMGRSAIGGNLRRQKTRSDGSCQSSRFAKACSFSTSRSVALCTSTSRATTRRK